ncbi:hypothetical protein ACYCFK_19925 [Stutzerimonas stutzeri]
MSAQSYFVALGNVRGLLNLPDAAPEDFVSLTMPVREEAWRWPRDLFPFFRQNLPDPASLNEHVERLRRFHPAPPSGSPKHREFCLQSLTINLTAEDQGL